MGILSKKYRIEMFMKRIWLFIFVAFLLIQCAAPEIKVNRQLDFRDSKKKYAILNFDYQGMNLSSKIARSAADLLAAQLYIKTKLSVIDRSIVKAVLAKNNIKASGRLSEDELNKMAMELNADYFILGSLVSNTSIEEANDNREVDISLNLRILDARRGEVQAMAYHSISSDKNISKIMEMLITQIVDALGKQKNKTEPEKTLQPAIRDTISVNVKN